MSDEWVARGAVTARDGLVIVDKPAGLSSHQVVARIRRLADTKKVGHAGTLDPMATGILVCGVGRATRLLHYLVGADKVYTARLRLGQSTNTDDREGEITDSPGLRELSEARLEEALAPWRGKVMQRPCLVSAIKVEGQRAYQMVRRGQDVELQARPVEIYRLEAGQITSTQAADGTPVQDVDITVACSSGTYVRALARDIGQALGCGGHLTELRRCQVGPFDLKGAASLELLDAQVQADAASENPQGLATLSITQAARSFLPELPVSENQARALSYGQAPKFSRPLPGQDKNPTQGLDSKDSTSSAPTEIWAAFGPDGEVVALVSVANGKLNPQLVLRPANQGGK